jgi:hypothetical protein
MPQRVFVIVDRTGKVWERLALEVRPELPGGLSKASWRRVYNRKAFAARICLRFVDCGVNG